MSGLSLTHSVSLGCCAPSFCSASIACHWTSTPIVLRSGVLSPELQDAQILWQTPCKLSAPACSISLHRNLPVLDYVYMIELYICVWVCICMYIGMLICVCMCVCTCVCRCFMHYVFCACIFVSISLSLLFFLSCPSCVFLFYPVGCQQDGSSL